MIAYPEIDPVALAIGPVKIHWYGITYLLAFAGFWFFARLKTRQKHVDWSYEQIDDLLFYGALGVVIGGRLGYTLFYNLDYFLQDPLILFQLQKGGMSFHGGLLGVLLAMWLFAKKNHKAFFTVTDFIAVMVPFGLAAGRIGNFINAELWGRPTDLPWAMVFPTDPLGLPRHPSMLYEFLLEGVVLFIILWLYSSKPRPRKAISGLFLIFYSLFRTVVEFVRQPDAHMGDKGFIAMDWLTMGMILSLPMFLFGLYLFWSSIQLEKQLLEKT
ncbi:MAG: prolipoprotein diacylglyceryl transferase [Gammaproteobacteria bacterium]|nr:prolipoprotein diacylglyceryl transferase [Gammaproteobacteria bacterium]